MSKEKIIPIFIFILLPFTCFSQQIKTSMLEELQTSRETFLTPQFKSDTLKTEELLSAKPESLSTIEKMFKERYMITARRTKLELLKDSIEEQMEAESLKIELRGKYLKDKILQDKYLIPADTTYFYLRKKLLKANKQLDSLSVTLKQFGYDMFGTTLKKMPVFAPVAADYVLGPGDELYIDVSGEINNSWTININRDGSIVLPYVGTVDLWGKTYAEGKKIISKKIKEEFSNIEVSMSLGYLKSVNVFVLGEVTKPGVYDLTFLSNPLAAFFQSKGIKKSGSLRKIKYISSEGTTQTIDLYRLFVKTTPLPTLQFSSGDMILVPPIGKVAGIDGAVNRPGIYELKGKEQLSSLIDMAGGFLPTAGTKRIKLERITQSGEKIAEDLRFENLNELEKISKNIELKNGDLVTVIELPPYLHNYVEIKGNVNSEGTYQLKDGMTVLDLIKEAGGVRKGTYMERAELLRFSGIETPAIININLKKLLEGNPEENIKLEEWDKLKIFTRDEVEEKFYVRIGGEVGNPGVYPLNSNMKVKDLLFIAQSLITSQDTAELFRIYPDKGNHIQKIDITNKNDLKIELKPDDYIQIYRRPTYREIAHIVLEGEFNFPGLYQIKKGTTLKEAIDIAGGLTENAYPEGAIFTKMSVRKLQNKALDDLSRETRMRLLTAQRAIMGSAAKPEEKIAQLKYIQIQENQLESIKKLKDPGRVIINLKDTSQLNIPLGNGDSIKVPRITKTVQIIGEVYNETGITYEERLSLNDYLDMAGGPKPTANEKEIYIRRASGKIVKCRRKTSSGKISSVEMKPGDTIIVPEKVKISKSGWEIISFTADILYKIGLSVAAIVAITK
jgi:protein involved in polysaccharide export with SLBB domain